MKFWPQNELQNLKQEKSEKWTKSSVSKVKNPTFEDSVSETISPLRVISGLNSSDLLFCYQNIIQIITNKTAFFTWKFAFLLFGIYNLASSVAYTYLGCPQKSFYSCRICVKLFELLKTT